MPQPREHPFRRYYDILAGLLIVVILVDLSIIVYRKTARPPIRVNRSKVLDLSARIDPNEAAAIDLECLPGITQKTATAICAYRLECRRRFPDRPAFTCLQDLKQVKGIADKTLARIGPFLSFPPARPPTTTRRASSAVK